jgi:hypothetical protein
VTEGKLVRAKEDLCNDGGRSEVLARRWCLDESLWSEVESFEVDMWTSAKSRS